MSGQRWLGTMILVSMIYLAIGIAASTFGGAAASAETVRIWRWSAFLSSGLAFAAHIAHERVRLRSGARRTAWHTTVAVALGAFGLALAANLHDLGSASGYRPRMLIALVAWPLLTALPAFLVALVVAASLGVKRA